MFFFAVGFVLFAVPTWYFWQKVVIPFKERRAIAKNVRELKRRQEQVEQAFYGSQTVADLIKATELWATLRREHVDLGEHFLVGPAFAQRMPGWGDQFYDQYARVARTLPTNQEREQVARMEWLVDSIYDPSLDEATEVAKNLARYGRVESETRGTSASGNDLRPQRLSDVIGQDKVVQQIRLLVEAAKQRGDVVEHMLLAGPPGLGKTTLSLIVANELGTHLHVTSGPALRSVKDLHVFLNRLNHGDLLFIDEVHRLPQPINEALYIAVEDFRADIDGQRVELPRFTLVGATTHAGLIPGPLRDRFGYTAYLEPYSEEDLATIVTENSRKLGIATRFTFGAAREIASRGRGTPRVANTLLKRVRDFSDAAFVTKITREVAAQAIDLYDIDSLGLDRLDRQVLTVLARQTGPIGLSTLAASAGEAEESVEESEGFLLRLGFIDRTPRGRQITDLGKAHIA